MTNDQQKSQRLKRNLAASAGLSFEQAQAQIPALVAAELAGDDVDTSFAAVLQAFDRYPALAEQYYQLMEEQTAFMASADPPATPVNIPQFFADPGRETANVGVWAWGKGLRQLLVRLSPKPTPVPQPFPTMDQTTIEYISEWLEHDAQSIQLTSVLSQRPDGRWVLVVSLFSGGTGMWQIDAAIKDRAIPVLERDEFETRFGPLDSIPEDQIMLICRSVAS